MDALELLKQDHQKMKGLFKETEGAEIFYSAMEKHEELVDMVAEARDEHAEVRMLLQEIELLGSDLEGLSSKLTELVETVVHHIEEEEGEMFEKVRELFNDKTLDQLGKELQIAKGKQHRAAS